MNYKSKYFKLPVNDTVIEGIQQPYVFNEDIVIAVDVALVTRRPLLVAGSPGNGKSRLAEAVAALLNWNYLTYTMTSRTNLEDLTNEIDQLQRLHDAQSGNQGKEMRPDWAYYKPGIFWWAFQPETAKCRGGNSVIASKLGAELEYPGIDRGSKHSVLLLDEIDKAEPDLPNDLLEPLDRYTFRINDNRKIVANDDLKILTIITTNQERQLPQAFLRRCIVLKLRDHDADSLVNIGKHHFPKADQELLQFLADKTIDLRKKMEKQAGRLPGTSEFLDAVDACLQLEIKLDSSEWENIEKYVLEKGII